MCALLLLVFCSICSLALSKPEPPVYTDDYGEPNEYLSGVGGGHVGTKTIVLLGGHGGGGGEYLPAKGGHGSFGGHGGSQEGHGGSHGGLGGSHGGFGGGGSYGGFGGGYEQSPVIQKHIYVHVPPPEPAAPSPQKVIPPPPPKKHYKIVFIKAPSNPTPAAPVIPAPQQDQEKTLIYVLHKHPQDSAPIVIPTPQPTVPSKPEVYFIRYKTQKEISPTYGPSYGSSTTLGPHFSSTFSPVTSTLGYKSSSSVSIVPRPSPSYSTTSNYH